MPKIRGPFEVKIAPQPISDVAAPTQIGRMSLDKRYSGALSGTAQGEMLAWRTPDGKSGGYVALEKVDATLAGKAGTFCLQHSSTMHEGAQAQSIRVVPGSGTGALVGLTGSMTVEITAGKHEYVFEYALSA
jgi:hypothetical protein